MKKLFGVFILGMIFVSLGASFVGAAEVVDNVKTGVSSVYKIIEPVLAYVVGETDSSAEFFLAKILFLLIIFAIVWVALSKIEFFTEKEWVLWVVSISVSILAVRWFGSAEVVRSVILPYSVLGITITAALPFLLYFSIVKNFHKTARTIAWIFFAIIFIGLWIMRSGEGDIGGFAWIYLATAGVALAMLMFDGTIQRILHQMESERKDVLRRRKRAREWREELEKVDKEYSTDPLNYKSIYVHSKPRGQQSYDADVKYIQRQIVSLRS